MFKFKFRGWKEVNPLPLLRLVHQHITAKSLQINLSNVPGSVELLMLLFSNMFEKYRFQKVDYNLEKYK